MPTQPPADRAVEGPPIEVEIEGSRTAAVDRQLVISDRRIAWPDVWRDVAGHLLGHHDHGRAHLLTEDSVRRALIEALETAGVPAADLMIEVSEPRVDGKLDLVVGQPAEVVFELKFPRDSKSGASPDTMTMGEMLRDFVRLARLDAPERWAVQLVGHRLRGYLERRTEFEWSFSPGDRFEVSGEQLAKMPRTALAHIPPWALGVSMSATCEAAIELPDSTLVAYRVD